MGFNGKVISVVSHGTVTLDRTQMYVDSSLGSFLDGLAPYFKHIFYIASCADRRETRLYPEGKSLFSYKPHSSNVSIIPAGTPAEAARAFSSQWRARI